MVSVPAVTLMPPPKVDVAGAAATLDRRAAVVEQHAIGLVEVVRLGRRRVLGATSPRWIAEIEIEARQSSGPPAGRRRSRTVRVEAGACRTGSARGRRCARRAHRRVTAPIPTPVATKSSRRLGEGGLAVEATHLHVQVAVGRSDAHGIPVPEDVERPHVDLHRERLNMPSAVTATVGSLAASFTSGPTAPSNPACRRGSPPAPKR